MKFVLKMKWFWYSCCMYTFLVLVDRNALKTKSVKMKSVLKMKWFQYPCCMYTFLVHGNPLKTNSFKIKPVLKMKWFQYPCCMYTFLMLVHGNPLKTYKNSLKTYENPLKTNSFIMTLFHSFLVLMDGNPLMANSIMMKFPLNTKWLKCCCTLSLGLCFCEAASQVVHTNDVLISVQHFSLWTNSQSVFENRGQIQTCILKSYKIHNRQTSFLTGQSMISSFSCMHSKQQVNHLQFFYIRGLGLVPKF